MVDLSEHRHKTAMKRATLSRPVTSALRDRIIRPEYSVFDFGCGYGTDVELLKSTGINAAGWDPHFANENLKSPSDVVNLGYVLNVIENVDENERRSKTFMKCSVQEKIRFPATGKMLQK